MTSAPSNAINLYEENGRIQTFINWPVSFLSPVLMAKAGFYYTGVDDIVSCPFCSVEVHSWVNGDDPKLDHERWSPGCRYLCLSGSQLSLTPNIHSSVATVTNRSNNMNNHDRVINNSALAFGHYASYTARISSFADWPINLKTKPHTLASAGLFYRGIGDHTMCYHCGGGIKDWAEENDPTIEHALLYPDCPRSAGVVNQQSKIQSTTSSAANVSTNGLIADTLSFDDAVDNMCKICFNNELSAVFVKCGHMVACMECAVTLTHCAVCRQPIVGTVRAFLS